MSEVIDRPPVLDKAPTEELKAVKPPGKYQVQAWSSGAVCKAKFAYVLNDVFSVPVSVGMQLGEVCGRERRVAVALNLSRDLAETKAGDATAKLMELVGDCDCGHKAKFVAVPEDE